MLILTRKSNESIIIGDDIKIIVLNVKGNQVRLGIEAPKNISIHREEIYERIQEEKRVTYADNKFPEGDYGFTDNHPAIPSDGSTECFIEPSGFSIRNLPTHSKETVVTVKKRKRIGNEV